MRGGAASAAGGSVSSLFVLGPAAFDPGDDDALSCPLVVSVAQGQRVNLTLYDFSAVPAAAAAASSHHVVATDDYDRYDQVPPTDLSVPSVS